MKMRPNPVLSKFGIFTFRVNFKQFGQNLKKMVFFVFGFKTSQTLLIEV